MIIKTAQEFYSFFRAGKSVISIDYGQKKIGIAITEVNLNLPMPLKLINVVSKKNTAQEIMHIIQTKKVCAIVIGWPLNMNGTKSDQTLIVETFAHYISNRTHLPIFLQDERLTSKAANVFLKTFGMKRKKRNAEDDLTAASMILETTLNLIERNMPLKQ